MVLRRWGRETQNFGFRALAFRQSEPRNCGLHLVYMGSGGATLLVRTWQREKQEQN